LENLEHKFIQAFYCVAHTWYRGALYRIIGVIQKNGSNLVPVSHSIKQRKKINR